ncbi:MAG: SRPBCC family protein [Methyloceanibacter sp.]
MRAFKLTLFAFAAIIAWTATADALEVKKRREAPGSPAEVWAIVGEFCAIKNWHPAVAECAETKEGDEVFRTLTLKDGAKLKEKLTDKDDTSYSYAIIEGPLPVADYEATLRVGEDDEPDRVEIVWRAEFDAKGVSDEEATKVISGIFNDGVTGIKKVAIDAYDKREAAKGEPVSKGRDMSEDGDDD